MKYLLAITLLLTLTACGGGDDDSNASNKPLFRLWFENGTDYPLDLQDGEFGRNVPYTTIFENGGACTCSLVILGNQNQGSYSMSSCYAYNLPYDAAQACSNVSETGTFRNDGTTLTINSPAGISTYY